MTNQLFAAALGIAAPWSVQTVDFDAGQRRLTIHVDFVPGSLRHSGLSDGGVAFGWPSLALSRLRSADQRSEAAANISKCRGVLAGDQHRDEWTAAYRSRTRPHGLENARAATLLRIRTAVRSDRTNR